LISPKVETRESKMIRQIPELMRDPEYLRFLADAQVGREMREKKAAGVKTIEIDPSKAKKAESASVAAPAKAPTAAAPAAKTTAQVRSPEAGFSYKELQLAAEKGSASAKAELRRLFLARS
jgi:hypothetical protein